LVDLVECHSEIEYPDRPVALYWQGQRLEIAKILTDWRTPAGKSFRVLTWDNQVFELSYQETTADWKINQI
jgi:hypothetical protein